MVKFKFPNFKIFLTIFLFNIVLFIFSFIIYKNIKISGAVSEQKVELSTISMEIASKISEKFHLSSRLSKIDFIKSYTPPISDIIDRDISLQIESMKKSIGASVVFLMDLNGDVILSSTYIRGKVLGGNNYFRPYFREARRGRTNFYGAIGDMTGTRGFYFASPVFKGGSIRYILALKFSLSEIDKIFTRYSGISGLLTPEGIIFSASRRDWLLKSLFPVKDEILESIRESKQFPNKQLGGAVFDIPSDKLTLSGNEYSIVYNRSVPGGWSIFSLKRVEKIPFPFILIPVFLVIFIFESLFYAFIYNVRKKKEAQRKYDESSERFRHLFQSALDSIFILNSKGIIVDINYAAMLKFGYSKSELVGKHFKRVVDKRSYKTVDREAMIIINDLNTRFEFRAVTKTGGRVLLDCSAILLKGVSSRSDIYFAFCHDITRQKKFENDLKKAIKAAKNANRAKSEFLANMSHEIRTPMNAILGFTEILSNSRLSKEQKNYLDIVIESGRSLLQIIDDILDFSKIEADKITFENIDIDIRKITIDAINIINIGMNKGRIKIFRLIDENIPQFIKGDPLRLKQILINLLSNAVKFTEEGEVKIEVKLYKDLGNWVSLYFGVSDTGIGISKTDSDKLFKPFSQIDGSSSRKHKGSGLGLVITSSLIKKMGGEIKVRSRKGKGSLFFFILSFEKGTDSGKREPVIEKSRRLKWKIDPSECSVLIVEDQKVNSMLLDYILKKEGFRTVIAEDGIEAVEIVKKEKFDLILMDIQMPRMDGVEAAKRIRRMKNGKIPVIALTADAMKGDRKRFLESGMDDYLEKPIGRNTLLKTIHKWVCK